MKQVSPSSTPLIVPLAGPFSTPVTSTGLPSASVTLRQSVNGVSSGVVLVSGSASWITGGTFGVTFTMTTRESHAPGGSHTSTVIASAPEYPTAGV